MLICDDMSLGEGFSLEEAARLRMVLLDGGSIEAKRREILEYFHATYLLHESLYDCLADEGVFYEKANPLRHPLIFYFGHTAVFFVNKLRVAGFIDARVDAAFESMFAIGVDEMSWDDLDETNYGWPSVAETKAYRDKVRILVDGFIRGCEAKLPISWEDPLWIILMGIEHERIHIETSSVLIRELPIDKVRKHDFWGGICVDSGEFPKNELLPVGGEIMALGKGRDGGEFYGWDNEYGNKIEYIEEFKASKYLVSNGEFLEFVEDGGYDNAEYWTAEGWDWVEFKGLGYPSFWVKGEKGEGFKYRTMLEVIDMAWDLPCDLNYLEAKAFCNWKSAKTGKYIRMPTEAEWGKLAERVAVEPPLWENKLGNLNLEDGMSSCPVTRHEFKDGFFDIMGNVWQWTETPIEGFEGFEVHEAYDDFSVPTFDGKHNVFKGGCWASTGNLTLKQSRYAFRRHFMQHAGLRYVEAEPLPVIDVDIYETDEILSQYIEFHYGGEYFGVENFPVACIEACRDEIMAGETRRVLDIGCAVGRASFELAKIFDHVDAVDFSARLIQIPTALQQKGTQRYVIRDEGKLVSYKEVRLKDFEGYDEVKDKISFMQGDACNLAEKYRDYDVVFTSNMIDRLYDPEKFLNLIKGRIRKGGLLIIASPYTWLEEFTEPSKWLGGYKAKTGENYTTLEGIAEVLGSEFERVGEALDVPFVIRETRRKFQHVISELSIWKKK